MIDTLKETLAEKLRRKGFKPRDDGICMNPKCAKRFSRMFSDDWFCCVACAVIESERVQPDQDRHKP